MLQFLQYKIFGRHRVPDGWIVVTAGNPPEYNRSVREFDVVTWDRLKRVDVEPDYAAWKQYACRCVGMHPAVLSYLEINKNHFYTVQNPPMSGKTLRHGARLGRSVSQMIRLYEQNGLEGGRKARAAVPAGKDNRQGFCRCITTCSTSTSSDYQIGRTFLTGTAPSRPSSGRAIAAKFDERLALLGLLLEATGAEMRETVEQETLLTDYMNAIKAFRMEIMAPHADAGKALSQAIRSQRDELERGKIAASLSAADRARKQKLILMLQELEPAVREAPDGAAAFKRAKDTFDKALKALRKQAEETGKRLSNVFNFCEEVFGDGQEILILVTELTISYYGARFISRYGCPEYFRHNKEILFHERQQEIIAELEKLELEE